ncbi:MAG: chemotaxis protein CheA, partial [Thermodesulfovibrionales bacterium]|nr:chemotaxis protein CheA [Thermodesulfovibrionales bacterium]
MASPLDAHKETYREEAYELLSELEESLLHLEENKDDMETVSRVFRALHTIKGSGSMFGFDNIASFTHNIENFYELIRNGERKVTKELIDLTLEARDFINTMLDASTSDDGFYDESAGEEILSSLIRLMPDQMAPDAAAGEGGDVPKDGDHVPQEVTYRITFKPDPVLFSRGINPIYLFDELRCMGRHYIAAHVSNIPTLDELDPEACYTSWDIILTTAMGIDTIRDVFIFVEDDAEISIDVIDEGGMFTEDADYKKLGVILIERGSITKEELESVVAGKKRIGALLVDSGLVEESTVESALCEQKLVKDIKKTRHAQSVASTIRVASEKLDRLVNLVGELVTVQARLSQTSLERKDPALTGIAEVVERLTSELHDNTMSIRMVPIGTTFTKFKRLVRDLGDELGRSVNLIASGGETELDKTVIERLNDPLVHLIRNSMDHGIEPPDIREAVGKDRNGTINIKASHSGADVLIEISDDGAGLDEQAIRSKAIEKGIITAETDLSRHEMHNLIFSAGFSTASRVTDVSGRGVGMDVVTRSIDALRGVVEVDSRKGSGTTIRLRIPLTLAIIEGLLVQLGPNSYVLPLSSVKQCVEITAKEIKAAHGRNLVNVRGEMVPYIRLRDRFAINGDRPEREQVVIAVVSDLRVGFAVDNVIGEHQTVIKSLSRVYKNVRGISGATIL